MNAAPPREDRAATPAEALATRRSVRAFLPTPVPRETVERILALAARAPSGTNMQPWAVQVVAGAAKDALCDAVQAAFDAGDPGEPEWQYYPDPFFEPYLSRRRKIGWDLYGLLGIGRGDKARMHAQHARNFRFFGAPVGMIVTIHRDLKIGSWLDLGIFLGGICTAARGEGLHTCLQAAWAPYHRIIRAHLPIPPEQTVVCGVALGHEDTAAPENALRTEREPVSAFARFHGL
ncbi:MAG: nitroreductase [Acetobacteraceae bacterium]|nr:nitroreductase [Acetobacteraceae bacterium]